MGGAWDMLGSCMAAVLICGTAANIAADKSCDRVVLEEAEFPYQKDGVCSSIHIRNNITQFKKLENCTVIDGYLRISAIDESDPEAFEKWSFPELREITAFMVVNNLAGLKSLVQLFPNLAVIRGRQLFVHYALVVFDSPDLEELGLINLRTISRGLVSITKNKKLCYVETVDWEQLGTDPGIALGVKFNKDKNLCPDNCPAVCPTSSSASGGNGAIRRCWSSEHCQKGLNCACKSPNQTCSDSGVCCHPNCLGGCSGPGPDHCISCKNVKYQNTCLPECPPNTYKYAERQCLSQRECLSLVNKTDNTAENTKIVQSDIADLRLCVTECPHNYTVQDEGAMKNLECIKCQGFCPKVCNGSEVNGIDKAQKLKGCSKIVGSLIIQIMGGSNVAVEMEKSLGSIREVTDFIVIRRSYALMTLYFLKNLEVIGGDNLLNGNSLYIESNDNLQDLFPEEQVRKMKLNAGKVSFNSNSKLCPKNIELFFYHLNSSKPDQYKGIIADNGISVPCNDIVLGLNVTSIFHNVVHLRWEKAQKIDEMHLLTYIIHYKQINSEDENISIYEGRDVCTSEVWMTHETPPGTEGMYEIQAINDLKAYTSYAVYVQAYTLSTASHSAMSLIKTFKTNPYYPSEPQDLEVTSDNDNELHIKWKPPKYPNGIVTHYKVLYQKQELDTRSFELRNYCQEPLTSAGVASKNKEGEKTDPLSTTNLTTACCPCPKSKEEREAEKRKREIENYFENYLHDQVYCQRYDSLPHDLKLEDILPDGENSTYYYLNLEKPVKSKNTTQYSLNKENVTAINTSNSKLIDGQPQGNAMQQDHNLTRIIHEVIVNDTSVYLPNLDHFQEYSIEIQACQDTNPDEPVATKLCSNRALAAGRTNAIASMDEINESSIQVIRGNESSHVWIMWEAPSRPNGLILTYYIRYRKASNENLVPHEICVNPKDFRKYSGYQLTNLDSGEWTFRICAVSLVGNCTYTPERSFQIESPEVDSSSSVVVVVVVTTVTCFCLIVGAVLIVAKYKFRKGGLEVFSPNINYIPSEPLYTMDDWEVDREKIRTVRPLGEGSFGMVYEGLAKGLRHAPDQEIPVAVKTVNDRASFNDKREFLKEATTMKAFDCFHVVKLLGVVSSGHPALVIMELMALGDLKNYLRQHRPDENERPGVVPPSLPDILQMAGEIADGMAYLADKKFVHRDLAARNCMVAEDKTVKIGDFGMTRDIYETDYYRKGGKGMLPVRWMAPESLRDGVFTSMSDVWSYGIVMWEMVTLAAQPYQGLSNEEVVKYISEDNTMDVPDRCPQEMAYLMQRCWTKKPKNRPSFKEIIQYLLPHLNARFQKVSYYFSDGGMPVAMDLPDSEELYPEETDSDSGSEQSLEAAAAASQRSESSASENFHSSLALNDDSVSVYDGHIGTEVGVRGGAAGGDGSRLYAGASSANHHSNSRLSADLHNPGRAFIPVGHLPPLLPDDFLAPALDKTPLQPRMSRAVCPVSSSQVGVQALPSLSPGYAPSSSYSSSHPHDKTATVPLLHQQLNPSVSQQTPAPLLASHQNVQVNQPELRSSSSSSNPAFFGVVPHITLDSHRNSPPSHISDDNQSRLSDRNQPIAPPSSTETPDSQPRKTLGSSSSVQGSVSPPVSAVNSSSDSSKESSKSSGSYSRINGLTNGHIPIIKHQTAPC